MKKTEKQIGEKSPTSGGHMGVVPNFPVVIRNEGIPQIVSSIQSAYKKWSLIGRKKVHLGLVSFCVFYLFLPKYAFVFDIPNETAAGAAGLNALNRVN